MTAFLIASLPSHLKSLEAVEYMQKKNFSIRISTNVSLMNFLMSSGGGDSRQLGVFEEIEPGKEEVHVFANLTCIFPSEIKVEADSTETSPSIENPVPIECIVKEEDVDFVAEQPEDRNPRLEITPEAVEPVENLDIPMVATENPQMDIEQAEEEMVDDHQEEREKEINFFLDQVENYDAMNENVLLTGEYEFGERNTDMLLDIPLPVAEQGVQAVQAELALEEVDEPTEEPNVLDEMEGEGNGQRNVDKLLEPLDDSMLSLLSSHNDELEEDLLEREVMDYKKGDDEDMEEFEDEEEELIEEQEHEDQKNDDDESEEEEECSDEEEERDEDVDSADEYDEEEQIQKKKKCDRVAGKSIDRLLFNCPVKNCTSSFSTFQELEEHMKIHLGMKDFSCDACKKNFPSKDAAMAHIRERQKRDCCACGRKCSNANDLTRHIRCHTGEKPFVCKNCGKGFSVAYTLKKHMLTHTGEKRFSCGVCKKRFALKHALKRHERVHTGEKPFTCSQCDYRCGYSSNLATHNRIHTGDKPFSCGYCEKRFTQKCALKTHELTHTQEKPFECSHCGKRFTDRSNLKVHIRFHTGQKPYSCKECDAKFTQSNSLNWHMKKKHK